MNKSQWHTEEERTALQTNWREREEEKGNKKIGQCRKANFEEREREIKKITTHTHW